MNFEVTENAFGWEVRTLCKDRLIRLETSYQGSSDNWPVRIYLVDENGNEKELRPCIFPVSGDWLDIIENPAYGATMEAAFSKGYQLAELEIEAMNIGTWHQPE